MMNRIMSRVWISPVTTATFIVVSISGLFLIFHIRVGNMMAMHEWMGYLFIAIGVVHLVLNWRPFVSYFRGRAATIAVAACLLASGALLLSKGQQRPDKLLQFLDANHDGVIDADELAGAAQKLKSLDTNGDGRITLDELRAIWENQK